MLERNFRIWLSLIILLVVAGVYYFSGSEQERLQERMLDARSDHDHEAALLYASKLLAMEPEHRQAKSVIQESGQIFAYLQAAKRALSEFETEDPEKFYKRFKTAKQFSSKAKAIDPEFETSQNFAETLDDAQADLVYILAMNVIEVGQTALSKAFEKYQLTAEIVDSAASSRYLKTLLSVQSAWAPVDSSVEKVRAEIAPLVERIRRTGDLVLEDKSQKTKNFTILLTTYVEIVQKTVDRLLSPHGSYDEYTRAVNNAKSLYEETRDKLAEAIPRSISKKQSVSNILKEIAEYKIFKNKSTEQIISSNNLS